MKKSISPLEDLSGLNNAHQNSEFDTHSTLAQDPTPHNSYRSMFPWKKVIAKLECVVTRDEFNRVITHINSKGFGFTSPLDNDGNTFYHKVGDHSFRALQTVLRFTPAAEFAVKNKHNLTPLDLAIKNNFRALAAALLAHGFTPTIAGYQNPNHSLRDYLYVEGQIMRFGDKFQLSTGINNILARGFRLDEPIDLADNTLLHYLVFYAPYHLFEKILDDNPHLNLNARNYRLSVVQLAIEKRRLLIVDLLLSRQVQYGSQEIEKLEEIELRYRYLYMGIPTYHKPNLHFTVLNELFMHIQAHHRNLNILPVKQQVSILFNVWIQYLKHNKWRYDPSSSSEMDTDIIPLNQHNLLDITVSHHLTVNCFDVAITFIHLLKHFQIDQVECVTYQNVTVESCGSRCFDSSWVIFDRQQHSFDQHAVALVTYPDNSQEYFDPTFCRSYTKHFDHMQAPRSILPDYSQRKNRRPYPATVNALCLAEEFERTLRI